MSATVMSSSDSAVISRTGSRSSAYQIRGGLSPLTSYSQKGSAIIITDVAVSDKDIALPVVATDDVRVLFKFGQDFGSITVSGRAYLGSNDCGNKQILGVIQGAFDASRLSVASSPCSVSVAGSRAYPCYPVELRFHNTQAETNSVGFSIICILVPT